MRDSLESLQDSLALTIRATLWPKDCAARRSRGARRQLLCEAVGMAAQPPAAGACSSWGSRVSPVVRGAE
jgi:hypothetical protein